MGSSSFLRHFLCFSKLALAPRSRARPLTLSPNPNNTQRIAAKDFRARRRKSDLDREMLSRQPRRRDQVQRERKHRTKRNAEKSHHRSLSRESPALGNVRRVVAIASSESVPFRVNLDTFLSRHAAQSEFERERKLNQCKYFNLFRSCPCWTGWEEGGEGGRP